jgi:hypothetical protein
MAVAQLVDISKHEFKEPQRLVKVPEDMEKWLNCQVSCLHAATQNRGYINLNLLHGELHVLIYATSWTNITFLCVTVRLNVYWEAFKNSCFLFHSSLVEGLGNCVIVTPKLLAETL